MSAIHVNGNNIYYDLIGSGSRDTVCFLHAIAADGGMWSGQIGPLLANGFSVLRIDLRGHGGSSASEGSYTVEDMCIDILAVLDANGIEQCHVIGLSIGGIIAQGLALRAPHRVRSLVICNALPRSLTAASASWQERVATVTVAGSLAPLADGMMDRWMTPSARHRDGVQWDRLLTGIKLTSVEGFAGCAALMQNFDFVPDLPSLKCPALVVGGSEDQAAPCGESKYLAALVPRGRYVEVEGARHFTNIEMPAYFNALLIGWCQEHSSEGVS